MRRIKYKFIILSGKGGGEKAASDLHVPFLGRLPVDGRIVAQSDCGKPFVCFDKDNVSSQTMDKIIMEIIKGLD